MELRHTDGVISEDTTPDVNEAQLFILLIFHLCAFVREARVRLLSGVFVYSKEIFIL